MQNTVWAFKPTVSTRKYYIDTGLSQLIGPWSLNYIIYNKSKHQKSQDMQTF